MENGKVTLKLGLGGFCQAIFTVLAVLCTLQKKGIQDFGFDLTTWPLCWLTWGEGVWDLIKTALCAWLVLPIICSTGLLLIAMFVTFLVAVIFKVLFKGVVKW